jgi:ABC-2 type transport system permease protein
MKAYQAILRARFATLFQYRAAAFAGLCTQIFWGIVKVMILTAFFTQSHAHQPISLSQAITFIWLGQALLRLLPWDIDKELERLIHKGDVAYELVRPLDLYWHWFFRSMAMRLVPTLFRSIPLFLVAWLFLGLAEPVSPLAALSFGVSLIFSTLLSSAITALVMTTLFWTIVGDGIVRLLPHAVMLLSGLVVPLPLFPDWMQSFLSFQPFRGIVDIPCRLYTGVIPSDQALYFIGFQFLWALVFIFAGKALMKKALKRFVIQGG